MVCVQLIFPFLELDIKYFDLGVTHRDATDDKVTVESAEATLKYVKINELVGKGRGKKELEVEPHFTRNFFMTF